MKFIKTKDYQDLSSAAGKVIADEIKLNPSSLICIATGSTPTGAYKELARIVTVDSVDCSKLRIIKLDEWGGLAMDDESTCEVYIQKYIINPLGISSDRYIRFVSSPDNLQKECARISRELAQHGPIDLCLLGLGANGHLGFNEPAEYLQGPPHVAKLSEKSLSHSMVKANQSPISYGLTLGMDAIMQAKKILFLVNGKHKAGVFKEFKQAQINQYFPASMLWSHLNAICIHDSDVEN